MSSTMFIIATQRCNVDTGVTNNSKTLVSDVQESQEKASVFCRRKIFTIRRLSAQVVPIYVSWMASSDVFFVWTKNSLFQQSRCATEISTVLMVLMNFCVRINQLHKHLLVMRHQNVPQAICIAIVPLNVWPWTRFCAIFQLNAKIKSIKDFVVTSNASVVLCGVWPDMRDPFLYSPHDDATTDQSAGRWKTNASHNVIHDHRFVMMIVGRKVAGGGMETVYVMDTLTGLVQQNAGEKWKKTVQ